MNNLSKKIGLKVILLSMGTAVFGQDDYATGGLSGAVRAVLDEAVKNGHVSGAVRDEITTEYDVGQRFLGEAFHRGQTGQISNPMRGVAQGLLNTIENITPPSPSEEPISSTTTIDLPTLPEEITVPLNIGENTSQELAALRQILIDGVIEDECGGGGVLDPEAVHIADLSTDGHDDFIVDGSGISCDPSATEFRPLNCGAQVCNSYFYIFKPDSNSFDKVWEQLAYIEGVTSEIPPNIQLYLHSGESVQMSWNGQTFSN